MGNRGGQCGEVRDSEREIERDEERDRERERYSGMGGWGAGGRGGAAFFSHALHASWSFSSAALAARRASRSLSASSLLSCSRPHRLTTSCCCLRRKGNWFIAACRLLQTGASVACRLPPAPLTDQGLYPNHPAASRNSKRRRVRRWVLEALQPRWR